jgi:hypothetical protein
LNIKNANAVKLAIKRMINKTKENFRMFLSKNATYKIARESAEFSQNRTNTFRKNFPVSNWGITP